MLAQSLDYSFQAALPGTHRFGRNSIRARIHRFTLDSPARNSILERPTLPERLRLSLQVRASLFGESPDPGRAGRGGGAVGTYSAGLGVPEWCWSCWHGAESSGPGAGATEAVSRTGVPCGGGAAGGGAFKRGNELLDSPALSRRPRGQVCFRQRPHVAEDVDAAATGPPGRGERLFAGLGGEKNSSIVWASDTITSSR